jgi:hypothetical protein
VLEGHELIGASCIHLGDESGFVAKGAKGATDTKGSERRMAKEQTRLKLCKRAAFVKPAARRLLQEMAVVPWHVMAAVHQGGMGRDGTAHITLRTTRVYHLRLGRSGCIFDITFVAGESVQRLSGKPALGAARSMKHPADLVGADSQQAGDLVLGLLVLPAGLDRLAGSGDAGGGD